MDETRPRVLRLFVSGKSASSQRARDNLRRLQEQSLSAEWRIEIIDVLVDSARAEQARVMATPTLSYDCEPRPRRIVGDLSDTARVMAFLGIATGSE